MRKPISFWSWESLKSWKLGGGRRRRKTTRRTRTMRVEALSPRIVLAAEIVPDDTVIEVSPVITEEVATAIEDVVTEVSSVDHHASTPEYRACV